MVRNLHVATTGSDYAAGTEKAPFRTISRAAVAARPGDTVIVHAGIYREWVSPACGGESDVKRIVYQVADGEAVVITGSEPITDWDHVAGNVWKTVLPDALFCCGNPFRDILRGDWYREPCGPQHSGDLYLDGINLFEVRDRAGVIEPRQYAGALYPERTMLTWCVEPVDDHVVIYANFGGTDPRKALVEVTMRPAVFFPRSTGINYLTVRGFEIRHAATPWAPPTAEQIGAIGPHWAKGWIIENCHIHDVRCSGISLGKERSTGQNFWTEDRLKHGTQRERETVFKAVRMGWSRDTVGSHIVRNNVIHDCEQTGICGHLGGIFSEITDNHIYDIHWKRSYSGGEMAGIKLHAPIDTLIARNHIHHCTQGLWMDWQCQGTRITGNLIYANEWNDLHVEVSHGPYMVDNNIMLSKISVKDVSQGGAFAHNLFGGRITQNLAPNRFTFYHDPHSTQVAGLMTILGGDNRYYCNLFAPMMNTVEDEADSAINNNTKDSQATKYKYGTFGTQLYEAFPQETDNWHEGQSAGHYAQHRLPVFIAHNCYYGKARPYHREINPAITADHDPAVTLTIEGDRVTLSLTIDSALETTVCPVVSTDMLGQAFQAEATYDNPGGGKLVLDTDYLGQFRSHTPIAGPIQGLTAGKHQIVVWPLR